MNARELAERFHEAYERLAPQFGYTTRLGTRVFDPESDNGRLMIAVVEEVCGPALRLLAAAEANDGSTPETDDAWTIGYASDNFGEAINQAAAALINREQTSSRIERERNGLAARVGELEKDAERYRWILHQAAITDFIFKFLKSNERHVSNAIDAERSK